MPQARRENFPVASRLLPRAIRSHLLATYGFARMVDDAGDEAPGDRLALLDSLERDLERAFDGTPEHPGFQRLGNHRREDRDDVERRNHELNHQGHQGHKETKLKVLALCVLRVLCGS